MFVVNHQNIKISPLQYKSKYVINFVNQGLFLRVIRNTIQCV